MTAIGVKPFRGQVPRISDRLLGANQAVAALNCKITSGRLDPLKGLGLVHTSLIAAIKTMYRYRFGAIDNWLVWDRVVDVVKSPTAQDALGRIFYTGDGEPRMTSYVDAIAGGGPYPAGFYVLGVTPPTVAPSLVVTGGSGTVETRAYVFIYRTRWGEESAPSPPVIVSGFIDGSWDLSAIQGAPPNSGTITGAATVATGVVEVELDSTFGLEAYEEVNFAGVTGMTDLNGKFALLSVNHGTNKVRVALTTAQAYAGGADTWSRVAPHNLSGMEKVIYRTVGNNVDYKRVTAIPVATTSHSDTAAATDLGEGITTIDSLPPPKNMHSLGVLANGAMCGIAGNQLCLSEQYKTYSWPTTNRYAFAGTGVAACVAENSVIVLTDGKPIVYTCTVPEAASPSVLDTVAPCLSKRGVIDIGGGCAYPGPDGLYIATPTSVRNVTDSLYRLDEWSQLVPGSFDAAFFDQKYYAMHDQLDGGNPMIWVLDLSEPDSVVEIDERVDALYRNTLDSHQYVAKGNKIYQWDADDTNRYLSFWRGRENQFGASLNFKVAQIHAKYSDIIPTNDSILEANEALLADADNIDGAVCAGGVNVYAVNGSALQLVPEVTERQVQFSLIVDGQVVFTKTVRSNKPFSLPAGFKSEIQAFQIAASIPVFSVSMATTERELAQVS